MTSIRVNTKCKQYRKEDRATQKQILAILEKLALKISSAGNDINAIFNNDSIIYDRVNSCIFVYKAHGVNNTQLRIIYGFEIVNGCAILYLIDYVNKKKNDKQYVCEVNGKFKNTAISDLSYSEIACVS